MQKEMSRDGLHRIGRFDEKSTTLAVSIITLVTAAILLVGSITAFYFITTPQVKLGMICVFTIAFALSVGLMTNVRRAEIFAATAA